MITWHTRYSSFVHDLLTSCLVPHVCHRARGRPNELDALLSAFGREFCIFGEEAIAWMYCLTALVLRYLQDLVLVEVCRCWTKVEGPRRGLSMLRVCIRVCVYCCSPDAVLGCCLSDTYGNLSSVCNQDRVQRPLWDSRGRCMICTALATDHSGSQCSPWPGHKDWS